MAVTSGVLDLRNLKWVYPTTLLPLGSMIRGRERDWNTIRQRKKMSEDTSIIWFR